MTNPILDGDMELNNVTDWPGTHITPTKSTTTPHGGTRCLVLTYLDAATGYATNPGTFVAGVLYNIVGWMQGDGTGVPVVNDGVSNIWTGTNSTAWQFVNVSAVWGGTVLKLGGNTLSAGKFVRADDFIARQSLNGEEVTEAPNEGTRGASHQGEVLRPYCATALVVSPVLASPIVVDPTLAATGTVTLVALPVLASSIEVDPTLVVTGTAALVVPPVVANPIVVDPTLTATGAADLVVPPVVANPITIDPTLAATGTADLVVPPVVANPITIDPTLAATGTVDLVVPPVVANPIEVDPTLLAIGTAPLVVPPIVANPIVIDPTLVEGAGPVPVPIPTESTMTPAAQLFASSTTGGGGGWSTTDPCEETEKPCRPCDPTPIEIARLVAVAAWQARTSEAARDWVVLALGSKPPRNPMHQLAALLREVRSSIVYLPDPVHTDRVTAPEHLFDMAILGRPASGDCADFVGMLVAACANIGLRTAVILQTLPNSQPHLIAAAFAQGRWVAMDPSTPGLALGQRGSAVSEVWVPLPGSGVSGSPAKIEEPAEFLGVAGADLSLAQLASAPIVPSAQAAVSPWVYVLIGAVAGVALTWAIIKLAN